MSTWWSTTQLRDEYFEYLNTHPTLAIWQISSLTRCDMRACPALIEQLAVWQIDQVPVLYRCDLYRTAGLGPHTCPPLRIGWQRGVGIQVEAVFRVTDTAVTSCSTQGKCVHVLCMWTCRDGFKTDTKVTKVTWPAVELGKKGKGKIDYLTEQVEKTQPKWKPQEITQKDETVQGQFAPRFFLLPPYRKQSVWRKGLPIITFISLSGFI